MAKVYDALGARKRSGAKHSESAATAHRAPGVGARGRPRDAAVRAPKPPRESLFRRFWPSAIAEEGAADFNKRRISQLQPDSYIAEQFRALRGRIDALETPDHRIRTIAMTSALPGEGKTTASINLALVTALSLGRRVLLVDCDLRRPRVHSALGLRPKAGLAEVLNGEVAFEEAVMRADGADLDVLAVRDRPVNPSELLSSPGMRDLIASVAKRYDRVILDTPAALGLPDAKAVGDQCDGLIMVVRADKTRQEDVQSVIEILGRGRMLGVVLNGTSVDQSRYGYQS
jgi:capsular exopolysaccharide synthesis family protein